MLSHDPKHGRWILPLIIVAMVILTYTFVNGIEPAVSPTGEPENPDPPFPTTPTSSTTTLPSNIAAFLVTLDIFDNQLNSFANEVNDINARWDSREELFNATREAFEDLKVRLSQWENDVAQIDGVPPELAESHVDLVIEVSDLPPKMDDIVLGLEAPDDGTLRRAATAEFAVEVQEVADAIAMIREQATSPSTGAEEGETSEDGTTTEDTSAGGDVEA